MGISLPAPEVAWQYSLFNRIAYSSVLQVAGATMLLVKNVLKAAGWTVKGSCNGVTGAMDGVDRWAAYTDATTRFSGVAGAQSWMVLTDGDGANIVFSFNSTADDVYRFWWSPTGVAVVNATNSAYEPTATDALQVSHLGGSIPSTVSNATSGDRIVSIWYTADRKNFRVAIARGNAWVSRFFKERYTPAQLGAGVSLHPGFAGFFGALTSTVNFVADQALLAVRQGADVLQVFNTCTRRLDGGGQNLVLARAIKIYGGHDSFSGFPASTLAAGVNVLNGGSVARPLQGGSIYAMKKMALASWQTGHEGDVGVMRDWWVGRGGVADGDTYGALQFIVVNGSFGILWPLDGVTTPVMS